jgi:hypothetical protein
MKRYVAELVGTFMLVFGVRCPLIFYTDLDLSFLQSHRRHSVDEPRTTVTMGERRTASAHIPRSFPRSCSWPARGGNDK